MRIFVRVETGRVLTIWLPDDALVHHLVSAIQESKQSQLVGFDVVCGASVLTDPQAKLSVFGHRDCRSLMHAFIRPKELDGLGHEDYLSFIHPPPNSAGCSVHSLVIRMGFTSQVFDALCQLPLEALDGMISMRDSNDDPVEVSFALDRPLQQLRMTPVEVLNTSCQCTIYIHGPALPVPCRSWQWSLHTAAMSSLRLLASLLPIDSESPTDCRLVNVVRQSSALLEELRHQLAAAFSIPSHSIACISLGTPPDRPLSSNHAVAQLTEADCLTVHVDSAIPAPAVPQAKALTPADWAAYYKEHWVNDASGYLAVCGKMSSEEEAKLILEVVAAFSGNEDNRDGIGRWEGQLPLQADAMAVDAVDAVPTTATISSSSVHVASKRVKHSSTKDDSIPLASRMSPWADALTRPPIFPSSSDAMAAYLRTHGYAIVQLDSSTMQAVQAAYDAAEAFFQQPAVVKGRCHSTTYKYLGYVDIQPFDKELLQIRRYCPEINRHLNALWSSEGHRALDAYYTSMHAVCAAVMKTILQHVGCEDMAYMDGLIEPAGNHHCHGHQLSRSNLSVFRYHPLLEAEQCHLTQCPYHSDITLVTIVPKARGRAGLHVFDWAEGKWMDVERGCPDDCAVVFTGELMLKASLHALTPTLHEVSFTPQEGSEEERLRQRISLPFQFCALDSAVIDPMQCKRAVEERRSIDQTLSGSKHYEEVFGREVAGDFMERVSRSRASVNFVK